MQIKTTAVYLHHQITNKTNRTMANQKTKQEENKERAIRYNELLKVCPKEQAKLARNLRKLGLL